MVYVSNPSLPLDRGGVGPAPPPRPLRGTWLRYTRMFLLSCRRRCCRCCRRLSVLPNPTAPKTTIKMKRQQQQTDTQTLRRLSLRSRIVIATVCRRHRRRRRHLLAETSIPTTKIDNKKQDSLTSIPSCPPQSLLELALLGCWL